jgi:hypothetical protein
MIKKKAPCNDQTAEQVEAYYRNVKPGNAAVLRLTHGNIFQYQLDKIADTNPKLGRVYVEQGNAWGGRAYYAKNGKSTIAPKGQANLIVPTEEVFAWIKENSGLLGNGILTYEVDYDFTPPGQRTGNRRASFTLGRARQAVMEKMGKKNES